MVVKITGANVFDGKTRKFNTRDVFFSDGKFCAPCDADEEIDAKGLFMTPGYVDIHTHGRCGTDIMTASPDELSALSMRYAESGVTSVLPTVMTATTEKLNAAIDNIKSAKDDGAKFRGIHVEGPYISPRKAGCHDVDLIRKPDYEEMKALAQRIYPLKTRFTIAPEETPDGVIEKLSWLGSVSIGHTCASDMQCAKALREGASSFTHVFNAMSALTHRNTGAAGAALASGAFAEFICDGLHASPTAICAAYNAKLRNPSSFVLITDSIPQASMPFGDYEMNGIPFRLSSDGAKKEDGTLVGSTLSMHDAVKNLMKFCGISLGSAIPCATENPAKAAGIFDEVGSIEEGKSADLLLLTDKLDIAGIFARGKRIK